MFDIFDVNIITESDPRGGSRQSQNNEYNLGCNPIMYSCTFGTWTGSAVDTEPGQRSVRVQHSGMAVVTVHQVRSLFRLVRGGLGGVAVGRFRGFSHFTQASIKLSCPGPSITKHFFFFRKSTLDCYSQDCNQMLPISEKLESDVLVKQAYRASAIWL